MVFGAGADFQDAVRKKIAKLEQIEDILEKNGETPSKKNSRKVLDLYNKFERFEADKKYRLKSYGSVDSTNRKDDKSD